MENKEKEWKEFKGNNGGFIWTEPVPPHLRACPTSDKVCVCSSDCKFLNITLKQPKTISKEELCLCVWWCVVAGVGTLHILLLLRGAMKMSVHEEGLAFDRV